VYKKTLLRRAGRALRDDKGRDTRASTSRRRLSDRVGPLSDTVGRQGDLIAVTAIDLFTVIYSIADTIRYDTRCYFNVRSKANMSQLNLPHGTDN